MIVSRALGWCGVLASVLLSGCGSASQDPRFVGTWRMVQMGKMKAPGTSVWILNRDGTATMSGLQGTWQAQGDTLEVVTPRLTYKTKPALSADGQTLTLVLPPDFGGGQVSPIVLQKAP